MSSTIGPELPGFEIEKVLSDDHTVIIHARSIRFKAICPVCNSISTRVHSTYLRCPADLPCCGKSIRLRLQVRRFFCPNEACHRKTFAERLPDLVPVHSQRTSRATQTLTYLAFACGGELGARASGILRMAVSPDTMIRLMRRAPEAEHPEPTVLAVDDWAWRKGHVYGTLLCDLERHCPLDLLPDRKAKTLADWLKAHPEIKIITRDRSQVYAEGASQGAPQAIQVADRWHLLKNLSDVVRDIFERHRKYLSWHIPVLPGSPSASLDLTHSPLSKSAKQKQVERRTERLERYQQVVALREKGLTIQAIATQVGISQRTVNRYLTSGTFPERKRRQPQGSLIDAYADYVLERWEEGCTNGTQIWRELCEQGFTGSLSTVLAYVRRLRQGLSLQRQTPDIVAQSHVRAYRAHEASWLFCCDPDNLNNEQAQDLAAIMRTCPDGPAIYSLAQNFRDMVRQHDPAALEPWLEEAEGSDMPEFKRFVGGLRQDKAAVLAALTLPWSNGQIEGQITRLKLIKRQMYGRANFDLLRKRVLQPV